MEIIYYHLPRKKKKGGMSTLIGANFVKLKVDDQLIKNNNKTKPLKSRITIVTTYRDAFNLRPSHLKFGCSTTEIEEQVILCHQVELDSNCAIFSRH